MLKQDFPSIEKFAAFLDGNLPWREMQQFSQMAEQDNALHQLLDASTVIDNTIAGFTDTDLQLPPEIAGSSFEIPSIPADGISPLVTLTPVPIDDMLVAAACADEDISMFSDDNLEDHSCIGNELTDDSSHLIPGDDDFGSGDDLSSSLPDDL